MQITSRKLTLKNRVIKKLILSFGEMNKTD
jgi:hypothetical protein